MIKLPNGSLVFHQLRDMDTTLHGWVTEWLSHDVWRAVATVVDGQLRWAYDKEQYTASGLARKIFEEACPNAERKNPSFEGPICWVTQTRNSLSRD